MNVLRIELKTKNLVLVNVESIDQSFDVSGSRLDVIQSIGGEQVASVHKLTGSEKAILTAASNEGRRTNLAIFHSIPNHAHKAEATS
jgi:hypothetical protein